MLHFQPGVAANVTNQNCDEAGAIEFIQQAPTVWASYTVKDNNGQVYAQGSNFTGSLTVSNLIPQEYILTLTHSSGYVAQEFITVNGTNPINATIEASATHVLVNETVSFVVTTNNATEYVWNFGDGVIEVSTNTTATHTYENNGIYNVVLTASNDECSTVATKVINVDNTTGIDGAQTQGVKIYGYGHHLVVEFDNWLNDKADVFMYNTLGQRVETFTGISTLKGRQELNVTGIKPGYYFIQVVSNGKVIGKKIFLDSF
jgi:PKD repeat protein